MVFKNPNGSIAVSEQMAPNSAKEPKGTKRVPGDPLPPWLVHRIRRQNHLTQEEFARVLGVKGGKGVVSAWERGKSTCRGPVAELILLEYNLAIIVNKRLNPQFMPGYGLIFSVQCSNCGTVADCSAMVLEAGASCGGCERTLVDLGD